MAYEKWLSLALLMALCSNACLLLVLTYYTIGLTGSIHDQDKPCHRQGPAQATETMVKTWNQNVDIHSGGPKADVHHPTLNHRIHNGDRGDIASRDGAREITKTAVADDSSLVYGILGHKKPVLAEGTMNKKLYFQSVHASYLKDNSNRVVEERSRPDRPANSETQLSNQGHFERSSQQSGVLDRLKHWISKHVGVASNKMLVSEQFIYSNNDIGPGRTSKRRHRRQAEKMLSDEYVERIPQLFKSFAEMERENISLSVSTSLVPALVQFEEMTTKRLGEMHYLLLSHDLRLERLEKAVLTIAKRRGMVNDRPLGPRRGDQYPELPITIMIENLTDKYGVEEQQPDGEASPEIPLSRNTSLEVDGESSGDDADYNITLPTETTPPKSTTTSTSTTTTTTTTTTRRPPREPEEYYDLLRDMAGMEQKVLALQNYNTMSDSELNRVRSEVTRMDDKVIEMQRRQKNTRAVSKIHTFKITELEKRMGRSDGMINSAMDSYGRLNTRVESFKDRLTEFKREVYSVSAQFLKQEQISNELRSMDSYKAHDIQELRKSMQAVESRLNDLYSQLDQSVAMAREDFRQWLDRLCINNMLAC